MNREGRDLPVPVRVLLFLVYLPRFCWVFLDLFRDSRVPVTPKVAVLAALAYAISPIDLLPDWHLPLLGLVEDVLLVYLALRWLVRSAPPRVLAEHVARRGRIP